MEREDEITEAMSEYEIARRDAEELVAFRHGEGHGCTHPVEAEGS